MIAHSRAMPDLARFCAILRDSDRHRMSSSMRLSFSVFSTLYKTRFGSTLSTATIQIDAMDKVQPSTTQQKRDLYLLEYKSLARGQDVLFTLLAHVLVCPHRRIVGQTFDCFSALCSVMAV